MALLDNKNPTTAAAAAAAAVITAISTAATANWPLFRRFSLFFLSFLFRLFDLIHSLLSPPPLSSSSYTTFSNPPSSFPTTRALSHLLFLISFVPVSSQKYHFARSLADRLLDENLICSPAGGLKEVNCVVLSDALERRIRWLEAVVGNENWRWMKWFGAPEKEGGGAGVVAEKVAGEVTWLAEKMAACGAVGEAVARWAAAGELGRSALNADGRIQVAFVRISVFLLRNAHRMQAELCQEKHAEYDDLSISITECCMSMLRTWLPLLCRAGNGVDTPIFTGCERAEILRVLDEMIQKLKLEQQEEILGIWLQHFISCPNSDWPNLESSYTRWYAYSRKQLLQ